MTGTRGGGVDGGVRTVVDRIVWVVRINGGGQAGGVKIIGIINWVSGGKSYNSEFGGLHKSLEKVSLSFKKKLN